MIEWNEARPLQTWPGAALARELMNEARPGARHTLLVGAMESLATLATPLAHDQSEHVDFLIRGYLRGLAAAAIVADLACLSRRWTGARDFALGGEEVEFLPPDAVMLGTLTLAMTAVGKAITMEEAWRDMPRVHPPQEQGETMAAIQQALGRATQARMTQVAARAEEAIGD